MIEGGLQQRWDGRAAMNFMLGGAGSGLIVFTVLARVTDAAAAVLLLAAVALVGAGLLCVWLEIGRPRRALNVLLHPRRSWMSREALAAAALLPLTLLAALGVALCREPAAILALAFVYCQGRMLQRARAIPAWREPTVVALIVATGLAEGAGLFFATQPWLAQGSHALLALFGALVLARLGAWLVYRRRLAGAGARNALAALRAAGLVLQVAGTLVPLLLVALVATGALSGADAVGRVVAIAGITAAGAGIWTKWALVRRAAFQQAFALPHWPVRGAPRRTA